MWVVWNDEYIIEEGSVKVIKDVPTRKSNLIYQLNKSSYTAIGQNLIEPTSLYGVYNGITTYLQNTKSYKDDDDMFKALNQKDNLGNKVFNELKVLMNG